MEVVLLWLDDLDDLVFAGALLADRVRVLALGVGAAAAAVLALGAVGAWAEGWVTASAFGAAGGVSLWLLAGLLGERGVGPGVMATQS